MKNNLNIEDVISEDIIDLDLAAGSKLEAINQLIDLLHNAGRITDKDEFLEQVLDREETETTDFGVGVAIPHGRSNAVTRASVAIGKVRTPIQWNSTPGSGEPPVFSIFLMASTTSDQGQSHLEIIAKIATLLLEEDFLAFLKTTTNTSSLIKKIKTSLGEE